MEMDSLVGQTLNNRYLIKEKLGGGGMGAVYRGHDPNLDRVVAVKVMHPHFAREPNFQGRFRQEARVLAKLKHPGIVAVYDYGQHGETLYIVMEYIAGDNLRDLLNRLWREGQWLPLSQSLQLVRQVCLAVDYANRQGILHRDIKPANIMMKDDKTQPGSSLQPVLTDLGLAKLAEGGVETQAGVSLGTPAYMSPEQAVGEKTDARSDVYSLGILLYELAVGRLPFPITSWSEAIRYHTKEPPPPPREANPNLPAVVEKAIFKALKKNPPERFGNAGELAEALNYVERKAPSHTVPPLATAGAKDIGTVYQESIINRPPSEPSSVPRLQQDHLVVLSPDKKSKRTVELRGQAITIGRELENDLPLEAEKVSRQHARIEFDGRDYRVTDLNSTNKTYLNNASLLPGVPQTWQPGQWLYVGGYWLLLRRGQGAGAVAPQPPALAPSQLSGPLPVEASAVEVNVEPKQLRLSPGSPAAVTLTVTNHQAQTERFRLSTSGSLPREWLLNPPGQVTIGGNSSQVVRLTLQAPRSPQAQAGEYRLELKVAGQTDGTKQAKTGCRVTVESFVAFHSEVSPERVQSRQPALVTLHNQGNAPATFSLAWQEPGRELFFDAPQRKVSLQPDEKKSVRFTVTPQQRRLVGGQERHPFTTEVSIDGLEPRSHPGVLISRGLLPKWAVAMAVVFIFLAGLGIIGWVLSAPRINDITVEPGQAVVGDTVTVKVNTFGLWPAITVNETPIASEESDYTFTAGTAGNQAIAVSLADLFGRVVTDSKAIAVIAPSPTPTTETLIAAQTPTSLAGGESAAASESSAGNGSSGGEAAGGQEPGAGAGEGTPAAPTSGNGEGGETSGEVSPPGADTPAAMSAPVVTATSTLSTPVTSAVTSTVTATPTETPTPTEAPTLTPTPTPTFTPSPTPVIINLTSLSSKARWASGQLTDASGNWKDVQDLPWMGEPGDNRGFVILSSTSLEDGSTQMALRTHPKWVAEGSIKGWHPWVKIPKNAVFEAQVGFVNGAAATDGVTFVVYEHHNENGRETWSRIAELRKGYTGSLQTILGDLSRFAGQEVGIELRVDAGPSSGQDWAVWVNPIIRENR